MSALHALLGPGAVTAATDGALRLSDAVLAAQRHHRAISGRPACRCSERCRIKADSGLPLERVCAHCGELTRPIREAGKLLCPWCEAPMGPGPLAPSAAAQPWEPRPARLLAA